MAGANDIRLGTVQQQSNTGRLTRSKSCVQSSNCRSFSRTSQSCVDPLRSLKASTPVSSARGQGVQSFQLTDILPYEPTFEERKTRISGLLAEIKKEQPLNECSLFKMPLTFRWFVWSPSLSSLYGFQKTQQSTKLAETSDYPVKKLLQRSNSSHTLTSAQSASTRKPPESSSKANQIARKDIVRLNMLSSARPAIKLKSQVKLNSQNELSSHRSLKLGVVPKYLTNRKAEWARKEEERLQSLPDPDCPIGHIVMPENERLGTLSQLQKSQDEMIVELNSLPFSRDSLRIRQKREDIEKQLNKIEEGIAILSKPKVFVRVNE